MIRIILNLTGPGWRKRIIFKLIYSSRSCVKYNENDNDNNGNEMKMVKNNPRGRKQLRAMPIGWCIMNAISLAGWWEKAPLISIKMNSMTIFIKTMGDIESKRHLDNKLI